MARSTARLLRGVSDAPAVYADSTAAGSASLAARLFAGHDAREAGAVFHSSFKNMPFGGPPRFAAGRACRVTPQETKQGNQRNKSEQ